MTNTPEPKPRKKWAAKPPAIGYLMVLDNQFRAYTSKMGATDELDASSNDGKVALAVLLTLMEHDAHPPITEGEAIAKMTQVVGGPDSQLGRCVVRNFATS
jgi:hypothetical protein